MTSRTTTRALSAVLVGTLGVTGVAALALTPAAQAAQTTAQQPSASRLWPTIAPDAGRSAHGQVVATITARAPIERVQVLIDGKAVSSRLVRYATTHHRVIYTPSNLAAGAHVVRVTAWDKAGYYAWQQWSFTVPAATVAPAKPSLTADKTRIRVGETVRISGQGFQPGIRISLSMGGVNTGAGGNYGSAVVDGAGRFSFLVTLKAYPDGSALKPGTIVLLAHADWSSPVAETQKATIQLQVMS